jgi:GDP/UDP-N,N'-diacetylbacillosamine 2-epimerase (hydrolysing)
MEVLVLTSSRADFGIYLPLLKKLQKGKEFQLKILAFGTHLSSYHAFTIQQIHDAGFEVDYQISSLLTKDDPEDIATSYSLTALKFSDFWKEKKGKFDWVLVLGDRFEMAAAVAAGIPFNIPFAHIHGGETTLGAIDNIYRHFITLASKLHFVSLERYKERVFQLLDYQDNNCIVAGSLSLDNLKEIQLLSIDSFRDKWGIDLNIPSVLITVHPETVSYEDNEHFSLEVYKALKIISQDKQLIITMPNADTAGTVFRRIFVQLQQENTSMVNLVENFGTQSYFTCMKYAGLLIGNTSSGIIEAASFKKYVLNLGDRQKGRIAGENVIHLPFVAQTILEETGIYFNRNYEGDNLYDRGGAADIVLKKLKEHASIP